MFGFSHVSVPIIISGSALSISTSVSWTLFLILWKFTTIVLREETLGFAGCCFGFLGEDVALGLPREDDGRQTVKLCRLSLVCSSDKLSKLLDTVVIELNILVWFGELQKLHIHDVDAFARWLNSADVITMQDRWHHLSQLSQARALCPHLTALVQTMYGYFDV